MTGFPLEDEPWEGPLDPPRDGAVGRGPSAPRRLLGTRYPTLVGPLALFMIGASGCYHPQGVDPRALMNELRQPGPLPESAPAVGGASRVLPTPTTLSEDRSVALALVWNRNLRAFRLTKGIAEGEVVSAGALNNPDVRMELTHIQERNLDKLGWELRLTWEPPRPGVRAGRVAAAEAHVDEVHQTLNEREWDLTCDVRTAYATLQALDDEIRVAEDTIANRQRLADAVAKRVERGGTTRLDLDLVRLSLISAEHAENERRLARTVAVAALIRLMGVQAFGDAIVVMGSVPANAADAADAAEPTRAQLEDRAVATRPAVAAAVAHHRATEETLRAETAARWPWFRFSSAPRLRRKESFGADTDLGFGVDVTLPILDTNRGHVQSATAARDAARAEITATLAVVRADIDRALAAVDGQRAMLRRLQTQIAPLLTEHDRILAIAAQAAELDLPSLIASENLVLASRIELIAARLEMRRAWIALERAVGTSLTTPASKP